MLLAGGLAVLVATSARPTEAATSGTVVGATVPSATAIGMTACTSMTAGSTDFGSMTAGSSATTTVDCDVRFGSSNDTSQLRIAQDDGVGTAMWAPTLGQLDQDYDGPAGGANGSFAMTIGTGSDVANAAITQRDGMLVVAGTCDGPANADACVSRFTTNGALDPTFDGPGAPGNGRFSFTLGTGTDSIVAIAVQADGKLVLAGECDGAADRDFCVARLTTTGALDTTFDGPTGSGNGIVILGRVGTDSVDSVALYPDGRHQWLWFNADGTWEAFGRRGKWSSGKWSQKGASEVCLKQSRPFPVPFKYCTAFPATGGVGAVWSSKSMEGDPIEVTVIKGIQRPAAKGAAAR